ncbi:MAG: glutamine--tRNA ligase/YqeY domain fusion protein [Gammaproteobacteria bacterium]|nr:glutamine--tRNA ligase/YqeY domain fusion protein [Gammaproteobacteria bacterium]
MSDTEHPESDNRPSNFIRNIIDVDLKNNKNDGQVVTRFPPEPNGYLHIGHAKSILLNFGIAEDYNGHCNLRFDDTNPHKENIEFVEAIKKDVEWLGCNWGDKVYFSSDYFDPLYDFAVQLIKKEKAYVCDLNAEEMREYRGTLIEAGKDSPFRNRTVTENLDLFARMKVGEFEDGSKVLRAKIDMASANINMRDPTLYRIRHGVIHHQTGAEWCLYPMYDFTHCISDALEGITHSICTLEFEDHRPLYDWFLDTLETESHPQQIEFSRLNLEHTITSKRKLTELVENGHVEGWDDPRMPTIAGLRRRGCTPAALREFIQRIGVTKSDNVIEMAVLEGCIRDDLNKNAPRRMAVLHPLKVIITNYPEDKEELLEAANHPQDESFGMRKLPFSRELYIDQEDFKEVPPKKYKRLIPGGEVRLRNSYVIRCDEVIKDSDGNVTELRCTYDVDTHGKKPEGRKVKGVIHWVSVRHAIEAEIRLYDRLFNHPTPDNSKDGKEYADHINPDSLRTLTHCYLEPTLSEATPGDQFQFEREGYYSLDLLCQAGNKPIYNRTVTLRDTWEKITKR